MLFCLVDCWKKARFRRTQMVDHIKHIFPFCVYRIYNLQQLPAQ